MIGLAILVCLLAGPDGKWVKKFLPTTANRLVFLITVLFIVGSEILKASTPCVTVRRG